MSKKMSTARMRACLKQLREMALTDADLTELDDPVSYNLIDRSGSALLEYDAITPEAACWKFIAEIAQAQCEAEYGGVDN